MSEHQAPAADPAVVIVGTGFAGLCMAIRLKQSGFDDFVLLEKADEVGGTWRENTYPGCACDIQPHLYSYSFEQNPHWSHHFAGQQEIWDYLKHCTDKYGIRDHIRFATELVSAEYDDDVHEWRVGTRGEGGATATFITRAVVLGVGTLHQPMYPKIPGLEQFAGTSFHSARWNHDYDLAGKRVAVIGTGASTVQFVPQIAEQVEHLHVFQRTPPWIMPKPHKAIRRWQQSIFSRIPAVQRMYRASIYWRMESRVLGAINPRLMPPFQGIARRHLRRQVTDAQLRRALTPEYTLGCKRVLISSDYYPALTRPHVELVADSIAEIREHSVVTNDGAERPVDAIILGTGFHPTDAFANLHVVGRAGLHLQDVWQDGQEAFLGVAVAGFPNLFLLLGPNSGLAHTSMVFMIEAQANYILRCLSLLGDTGADSMEPRGTVQNAFNRDLQARLAKAVWGVGSCDSWYLDAAGRNTTLWPRSTWRYWLSTRRPKPADYQLDHVPHSSVPDEEAVRQP